MRALSLGVDQATLEALAFQQDLALHVRPPYQPGLDKLAQEKAFRNRYWTASKPGLMLLFMHRNNQTVRLHIAPGTLVEA